MLHPQDVIRLLTSAADSPKKSGSAPVNIITAASGAPVLRVDGRKRKEVKVTLLLAGGATRAEADAALHALLDSHWPAHAS